MICICCKSAAKFVTKLNWEKQGERYCSKTERRKSLQQVRNYFATRITILFLII